MLKCFGGGHLKFTLSAVATVCDWLQDGSLDAVGL